MRIVDMKVYPVAVPCRSDLPYFKTTLETQKTINFIIIELFTDKGITGIGEAPTIDTWSEGQVATAYTLSHILKDAIVGEDPFNIEKINLKMDRVIKGYPIAKSSIDIALYDIQGKDLGVPVYQLLGGKCRDNVCISRSIGIADLSNTIKWARQHVNIGSRTIKLKTGEDPLHDIEAVKACRKEFGVELNIKIDANQGYQESKIAINTIKRMEEFNLYLAEQPVYGWDLDGMAKVTASVDTPIVADESIWGLEDIQKVIEKNAADVFCIYLSKAGGITKNKKVAHTAESAAIPCILGGMGDLGVGTAANLHFAISTPNIKYPSDLYIPPTLAVDDIIDKPLEYKGDLAFVPEDPGLGVKLDYQKIERYGIKLK